MLLNGKPLPFAVLQTRIGRKNLQRNNYRKHLLLFLLMIFWNIMAKTGEKDLMTERREQLEEIVSRPINNPAIQFHRLLNFQHWDELSELRKTFKRYEQRRHYAEKKKFCLPGRKKKR